MRRSRKDIESTWYDVFSRWTKGDREAALKVLNVLHRQLPDKPRARGVEVEAESATLLAGQEVGA